MLDIIPTPEEMTVYFNRFSILDHFLNFLFPYADQRFFHPPFRTITVKLGRDFLADLQAKFSQNIT